jgi:hypothetical protein
MDERRGLSLEEALGWGESRNSSRRSRKVDDKQDRVIAILIGFVYTLRHLDRLFSIGVIAKGACEVFLHEWFSADPHRVAALLREM